MKRRSDGKEPEKIAWIHCVGMRSEQEDAHPYCSNFCCMAALKQAIIAREHIGPDLDMALFYIDMRTPRKDFEKYCVSIKEEGARLIRSRVHSIKPSGGNGDLIIRYVTETGEILEEIFEVVVLSVGGVAPPETIDLARTLGVKLSHNKFMDTQCFAPVTTSRSGIYSCGFFNGPKDIPQTVMEGSAAAAACASVLAEARGTQVREKVFPPERDVGDEPPRIGVFVCHCGLNIGGVADVPGIVVLAIGAEPYRPVGEYLYGRNPNILLALDLDQEIAEESDRLKKAQAAAFIQCVGSRTAERPYCSKVCCSHSVENALKLKDLNPDMDVYVLFRDMRTYGEREMFYEEARDQGVIFIRYRLADPPRVEETNGRLKITVTDHILQRPVEIPVDILTLATAIVPHHNAPLAELYKILLNAEGFFSEAHAKIKPVEASTEGIYLGGLSHYPKPLQESVAEAMATASRAATILSKDILELESTISRVVDENCDGCAFCVDTCPFKAITLIEYMFEGKLKKTVEVNEVKCKGCGSCMATCPKKGIYVAGFSLDQLGAQVEAALGIA